MRIGVISDIHGNLEALSATLEALADVDHVVCLGDAVGYGANPNECCHRLMTACRTAIRGNHDRAALDESLAEEFNNDARVAAFWTAEVLDRTSWFYLNALPDVAEAGSALLVHGAPSDPDGYVLCAEQAQLEFFLMDAAVCFFGHTHLPEAYGYEASSAVATPIGLTAGKPLRLASTTRYLLNPGSVGQPRDGDPRASCGVYDEQVGTFELRRVEYNVRRAQEKILRAGLPPFLASRLETGG
ncbi:MAG TPA: metallophosphoesterase family protein [Armatimonadota bacterium]|nr:metallophosphoesterase family protein [Armatimonadota bacterium]HQK95346.1 metallophosphoesterase family protein [Armatimonadota bacterium]